MSIYHFEALDAAMRPMDLVTGTEITVNDGDLVDEVAEDWLLEEGLVTEVYLDGKVSLVVNQAVRYLTVTFDDEVEHLVRLNGDRCLTSIEVIF